MEKMRCGSRNSFGREWCGGHIPVPQVPILAVSRLAGQYFAFVAEPQNGGAYVARQKPLKIGQTVGNDYEVLDGIKPGDKVIVSGTQFLQDGAPVIPRASRGVRLSAFVCQS